MFTILFMMTFNAYPQSIEYSDSEKTYVLYDQSCEKVKKNLEELYNSSINQLECKCTLQNRCSSKISFDRLPPKISYLLKKRDLKINGPNCYNSVMYLAGIVPGIYFSTGEIEIWLQSSLCQNITSKEARQGDFISFQNLETNSGHIMMYLTDSLSFNKSMGSKSDPYEIVETKKYIENYQDGSSNKILSECINIPIIKAIQSKKCLSKYTTVYRCKSFEEEFSFQIDKHKEIWAQYNEWGDCLNDYFLEGNENLYSQIKIMMKILASYVKDKAKIPSFDDLPTSLKNKIKNSYGGFSQDQYNTLTAKYYILTHTKNNSQKNDIERAFFKEFSKAYGEISKKDMLFLGNIYLGTSREKIGWSN